jgi:hypothetical protein
MTYREQEKWLEALRMRRTKMSGSLWYWRYLGGDWNVENGPAFQLVSDLKLINCLSREAVGTRLYAVARMFALMSRYQW